MRLIVMVSLFQSGFHDYQLDEPWGPQGALIIVSLSLNFSSVTAEELQDPQGIQGEPSPIPSFQEKGSPIQIIITVTSELAPQFSIR